MYAYKYDKYEYPTTATGWPRLIRSPKLQIIFHKRATKYRSLLQKMTHKDKRSYESSPPCNANYAVLSLPLVWWVSVCTGVYAYMCVLHIHNPHY